MEDIYPHQRPDWVPESSTLSHHHFKVQFDSAGIGLAGIEFAPLSCFLG
jgi:hypothetical protein